MIAGNFLRVLEFMASQANHDPYAPALQKGVQVILDRRRVTLISVCTGSTTTVEMLPQAVSGGGGAFFVPFDDIETLLPPLRHDVTAKVTLSLGEQPLAPGRLSLHVSVGDWFTADIGDHKPTGMPKRSAVKATTEITYQMVKTSAGALVVLDDGGRTFGHRKVGDNAFEVFLPAPSFGIKSVVKKIY